MRIVGFVLAEGGTKNGFIDTAFHLIKLPLAAKKIRWVCCDVQKIEKSMKARRDEKGYVMMGVKEFLLDRNSLEL